MIFSMQEDKDRTKELEERRKKQNHKQTPEQYKLGQISL